MQRGLVPYFVKVYASVLRPSSWSNARDVPNDSHNVGGLGDSLPHLIEPTRDPSTLPCV